MEVRRITINIAGRTYPLNVPAAEEEILRRTGKEIEKMIKEFEANFDIRDKQDALAMCCLQLGNATETLKQKNDDIRSTSKEKIEALSRVIDTLEK